MGRRERCTTPGDPYTQTPHQHFPHPPGSQRRTPQHKKTGCVRFFALSYRLPLTPLVAGQLSPSLSPRRSAVTSPLHLPPHHFRSPSPLTAHRL